MRNTIVALLLLVAIACQPADTEVDEEETAARDTTVVEMAPAPPPPSPTIQGTVGANGLTLGWYNGKACIEIPADAVPEGTVITIELVGDVVGRSLKEQAEQHGYPTVLPPVYEFSAEPGFEIEDPKKSYTMGICANSGRGKPFPNGAAIARFGDTFGTLESADAPACLRCPNGESARANSNSFLSGSFLDPTPLHAAPLAEEGIGGRGTGLSTFAVVAP